MVHSESVGSARTYCGYQSGKKGVITAAVWFGQGLTGTTENTTTKGRYDSASTTEGRPDTTSTTKEGATTVRRERPGSESTIAKVNATSTYCGYSYTGAVRQTKSAGPTDGTSH